MSFLPHELFSHLLLTSANKIKVGHENSSKHSFTSTNHFTNNNNNNNNTSSLHSSNKSFLVWNSFDVDFDVCESEPLKVHLTSHHVRSINKSLPIKK
ncbi:hypothetical protein HanRHA438_Chr11g0507841 [Helianthus annuus]|nr:hypothetical protein HanIR_Chr11g0533211 [Helianthus annuus]KAJ0871058.1 hypothetical protein HanRHA438_Chr11g0507841 [Helianthus annuus]